MRISCTGVILAGGLNTRFSGAPKALLPVKGRRILDRLHDLFGDLFPETILVTNRPLDYLEWNLDITTDLFPVRSSLTGIHAGLFHARTPYAFFAACDTPFLKPEMVRTVLGAVDPGADAVVPRTAMGYEPLCAVYHRRCLNVIARHLTARRLKTQDVFKDVRLKEIPEETLRRADPELISFFNVNTPADLLQAENG